MSKDTLPAKSLKNALTKLQDAQSALKMAADELAIVDAEMIGSDSHRRLIVGFRSAHQKPTEAS